MLVCEIACLCLHVFLHMLIESDSNMDLEQSTPTVFQAPIICRQKFAKAEFYVKADYPRCIYKGLTRYLAMYNP